MREREEGERKGREKGEREREREMQSMIYKPKIYISVYTPVLHAINTYDKVFSWNSAYI